MADSMPFSPLWWVERLEPKLREQQIMTDRYEKYFDGDQPLPVALSTKEYRKEFGAMLAAVRDNWMPLVVEAVAERLNPEGFRLTDDPKADDEAAMMWQRNFLDADSKLAHLTALTTGRCPIMVWAGKDSSAEITVEHPSQVLVAYESGSRRRRAAALKMWQDEWTDQWFYNLYLPDRIYKFARRGSAGLADRGESIANPLGVVPIVELRNRLRLRDSAARSELMEVISTQDQIDKTLVDMLVAAEFAAFRQRWATGVEIPVDADGKPIEEFTSSVQRLWAVGDEKAKFGDFNPTDLKQYVEVIESRVLSIARRTRTPPHYMLGSAGQFPSGESIKAAETGLVAKVRDRHVTFGETWEEVVRLGFAVEGSDKAGAVAAETIWADPESRTESEHVDAVMKKKTLGVPTLQLWEDLGYTPQQIARFKTMLLDEAMLRLMNEPAMSSAAVPAVEPAAVV